MLQLAIKCLYFFFSTVRLACPDERFDSVKLAYKQMMVDMLTSAERIQRYLNEKQQSALLDNPGNMYYPFLLTVLLFIRSQMIFRKKDYDDSSKDTPSSDVLGSAIIVKNSNTKWSDLAGLAEAKTTLQEAILTPLKFPELFSGARQPWKGILLYGVSFILRLLHFFLFFFYIFFSFFFFSFKPPGTGKASLVAAAATQINATLLSVSCADLLPKWVGPSDTFIPPPLSMHSTSVNTPLTVISLFFVSHYIYVSECLDASSLSSTSRRRGRPLLSSLMTSMLSPVNTPHET